MKPKRKRRRTYLEQIEAFATHFHTFTVHIMLTCVIKCLLVT